MPDLILCAVDGSDAMGRVLDTGRWLADALGERLVVLSVTSGQPADGDAGEITAAVRAHLGDNSAEVWVVEGDAAPTIRAVAAEDEPDLIVVGSRGHGAFRSALLGSVSREVAAGAGLPVVVVPSGQLSSSDADGDESLICGVDGSDPALAAVALAGQLATRMGLRLVIVHARQNVRAAMAYRGARPTTPPVTGQEDSVAGLVDDLMERALAVAGGDATSIIEPGPPAEVLETVAQREGGRLIVIATRGTGGVRSAILGSVASELAANAARPVLVLSEAAAAAVADGHPMLTGD